MKYLIKFIRTGGNSSKYCAALVIIGGKSLVQLFTVIRAFCNFDHIMREKKSDAKLRDVT